MLTAIGLSVCAVMAGAVAAEARPNVSVMGPAMASDGVNFSLHLPLRNVAELDALIANQSSPGSPLYHHWLTPAQFRASYGPDPVRVGTVLGALQAAGLQAARTSTQFISVHGSATAIERLLATNLARVTDAKTGRTRVAALTSYTVPDALTQSGATLLNLHPGVTRRPMLRRKAVAPGASGLNRYGPEGPYWADDLKQAYQYPAYQTVNGAGVSVAIVDGGDFSDRDLALYLAHERVGPLKTDLAPASKTFHVLLPGAHKFTSNPNDPTSGDSFEANLDAQQVALTAPGAQLTAVITADDSDGSFLDAYVQIIESNAYDIVSTSYGSCELLYLPAFAAANAPGYDGVGVLKSEEDIYKQGNAQGITFVNASGDNGALDCPALGYFTHKPTTPQTVYPSVLTVDAPADMPNVIGVGGGDLTTLVPASGLRAAYAHEQSVAGSVTDDPYGTGNLVTEIISAGGGISQVFSRPNYQKLVNTGSPMRTVPDVGGHFGAFSASGSSDAVVFAGQVLGGYIGTSFSCPDFAGLLALKASAEHSRLGLENPDIYNLSAHNDSLGYFFFHQSNPGTDGVYTYTRAHQGYNYIYGVGSPHGANFAGLATLPLAGNPQTPSNP